MCFGGGMPDAPTPEPVPPDAPDIDTDKLAKLRNSARMRRTSRTGLIIDPTGVQAPSTGLSIPGPSQQ